MKNIIRTLLATIGICASVNASATLPQHCPGEPQRIDSLLNAVATAEANGQNGTAAAAVLLKDGRADLSFKKDTTATLQLNTHTFTPLTFVNTCIALKNTAAQNQPTWMEFERAFTQMTCRRGENNGFGSIMWHISDWAGDNSYRGNIKELTDNFDGARSKTKSLDYLTRHRSEFAPLAIDSIYDRVRMTEMGFRTHRIPFLPKSHITRKDVVDDIKPGDVIVLIANPDGEDCYMAGVVTDSPEGYCLTGFDPSAGQVTTTPPLAKYFKLMTKYFCGWRLFRP